MFYLILIYLNIKIIKCQETVHININLSPILWQGGLNIRISEKFDVANRNDKKQNKILYNFCFIGLRPWSSVYVGTIRIK